LEGKNQGLKIIIQRHKCRSDFELRSFASQNSKLKHDYTAIHEGALVSNMNQPFGACYRCVTSMYIDIFADVIYKD